MAVFVNHHYRSFSTELADRPYNFTVLIAVDASEHSEQAFDWYMETVHRPMNRAILVHVAEGPYVDVECGAMLTEEDVERYVETSNKELDEMISKYQQKLEAVSVNATYRIVAGKPGEVIIEEVQRDDVQLIVLGSRGMGKLRRTILGSVCDYVVQHATIPVFVYRTE